MTSLAAIAQLLGLPGPWVEQGSVHWLDLGSLSLRALASHMNLLHARFVTITANELSAGEGFRLEYHWDLEGRLLGFPLHVSGRQIESIADLCEAADWIEREIHEEYAIDFIGHAYEPLLLREGDQLGVNLRETEARATPPAPAPAEQEAAK